MSSTSTKKKITAALFALTLPFGLAACGGGGKASQEDFEDGMRDLVAKAGVDIETLRAQGLDDEQIDSYFTCISDNAYDDLSEDFVNAVAEGNESEEMSSEDQKILGDAVNTCSTELQNNITGN